MPLFNHTVNDLGDWSKIYDKSEPFEALVRHILALHSLPVLPLGKTTPGSHAVFHVGKVIVKVFAPDTVGWNCEEDFTTEITAMQRANELGIPTPKLLAHGRIEDKYLFRYLIMDFVDGTEFGKAKLSDAEKFAVGQKLRAMCDTMNTSCEKFNSYDVKQGAIDSDKWGNFPESFQNERLGWLNSRQFTNLVYTHGDIHNDNAIYTPDGEVVILDFADSVIAPVSYEYAALIPGLFEFEKPYLDGFMPGWSVEDLADILTEGLLMHRFGANIIIDSDIKPSEVTGIAVLKEKIAGLLK